MTETSSDILAELRAREGNTAVSVPPPAPPALVRTSHHVRLDTYGQPCEEVVCLTYSTTWRGTPCLVAMELKRGRSTNWRHKADGPTADPWQPWRAWATSANEIDDRSAADHSLVRSGKGLTELARRRLSEGLEETALDYLSSAEFPQGRRAATLKALDPDHNRHAHYQHLDTCARDLRAGLRHCAEWLTAEDLQRGEALAAGYLELDAGRAAFADARHRTVTR